jgi:uncharacterized protein (TIGR03437 family)
MNRILFPAACAVMLFAPLASKSQTIIDTFGPGETFSEPSVGVGSGRLAGYSEAQGGLTLAVAFSPSSPAYVSRIDLAVQYVYLSDRSPGPADLDVTIAANNAGLPGSAIETIHITNAFAGIPGSVGILAANSLSHPLLQANTLYWLVVVPPDPYNTAFEWFLSPRHDLSLPEASRLGDMPWEAVPAGQSITAFAIFGTQSAGIVPVIGNGGLVDAASFRSTISSGSWISIFGSNPSQTTRTWGASDFTGGILPVSLDGVAVQINGYPAAVSYISPGQINAQAPDGLGPGTVTVQVITPAGPSNLVEADAEWSAPAFFTIDTAGANYVAATYPDGSIVGKPGLLGNLPARAAKPGDIISAYGTGFGPTTPAVAAGLLFSGAAPLNSWEELTVLIGNVPATVEFAGLSATGLYQFNLTVPELPDGDQPITAVLDGVQSQPSVYLSVQH